MSIDAMAILQRAWKITWENKILWLFGVLAGLAGGGSANFRFSGQSSYQFDGQEFGPGNWPPQVQRFFDRFDPSIWAAIVIGLVCLGLIIGLVIIALSVIGRGGLIGGVQIAAAQGKVSFGEAWAAGLKHFWSLFFIGLVVGMVTILAVITTVVPGAFFAAVTFGLGAICLVPLACVLALAAVVLNIVAYFAQIAAVVENLGVMDALRRGWQVLSTNLGAILIVGLITIIVGVVANFLMALPLTLIAAPLVLAVIGFASESSRLGNAGLVIAGLCFVAYLPVLIVLSGVLQSWVTGAWTLTYQQLTGAQGAAPATA